MLCATRLRQTDYNGDFEYSPVVAVNFRTEEYYSVHFDHESESVVVIRSSTRSGPTQVGLFDMSGQLLFSEVMQSNELIIDTRKFSRGFYFLKIHSDLRSEVSKVFIY